MSTPRPRVVITGLGLVSPIGSDLETVWKNLREGTSGISPLANLPTASLPCVSGGEVKDFTGSIEDYGELDKKLQRSIKKNMKVMCREIEMGVAASQKALTHSGLTDFQPERCGCLFGCDYILTRPEEYADGLKNCRESAGGEFDVADWPEKGLSKVNPLWLLKYLPNMPNSHVSIYNDFRGPNNSLTVREASMNLALAESASIIQRGAADVMLVGATGSRIHPLRTPHALLNEKISEERDPPSAMARPFDSEATGMVLGEGAGAIMLESLDHAVARGAQIWGEVIGQGAAMVDCSSSTQNLSQAIRASLSAAIASSGERLPQNWHVHAHGLGVPEIDAAEAEAIEAALENHPNTPVTAAKSYFGNLGAGSGAVELICSLLALKHGNLFPIKNLDSPGPSVTWTPATLDSQAGSGFIHSSFTLQGQASSLAICSGPAV